MPELMISPEKVSFLIEKAREFDVKDGASDPDSGSNAADDDMIDVLEDSADDPVEREITGFINALSEDEQIDLVALMWLGRGDGSIEEWDDLRRQASEQPQPPHSPLSPGRADAGRFPRRRPRRVRPDLGRRAHHAGERLARAVDNDGADLVAFLDSHVSLRGVGQCILSGDIVDARACREPLRDIGLRRREQWWRQCEQYQRP